MTHSGDCLNQRHLRRTSAVMPDRLNAVATVFTERPVRGAITRCHHRNSVTPLPDERQPVRGTGVDTPIC